MTHTVTYLPETEIHQHVKSFIDRADEGRPLLENHAKRNWHEMLVHEVEVAPPGGAEIVVNDLLNSQLFTDCGIFSALQPLYVVFTVTSSRYDSCSIVIKPRVECYMHHEFEFGMNFILTLKLFLLLHPYQNWQRPNQLLSTMIFHLAGLIHQHF